MLKSWTIQNFKPILDSGELKLAPVTVLAGRNSSGKSSLIQSILMISQTLSSRVLDRPLLPNGPIVQLGTFEDILSEQTTLRTLTVGFELEIGKEEPREAQKTSSNARLRVVDGRVITRLGTNIQSVKMNAQFRSANSNGTSTSAIEASKVNVEYVTLEIVAGPFSRYHPSQAETNTLLEFGLEVKLLTPAEFSKFIEDVAPGYLRFVPSTAEEPKYTATFTPEESSQASRTPNQFLVTFSHFLPTRLIGKYAVEERRKRRLMQTIGRAFDMIDETGDTSALLRIPPDLTETEIASSQTFKDAVQSLCQNENIQEVFSGRTLLDVLQWYTSLKPRKRKRVISDKLRAIVIQCTSEESKADSKETQALEVVTNNTYIESFEESIEKITQFFTSKIRYLGPLRADPQAAQKFAPTSELDDVGTKGEYAAAVYDANQNARIMWYNPLSKCVEQGILREALNSWARYLGVANEVNIQEAGQSGVSWQIVHRPGQKGLPLTAVGVGVSQVLPILIMGLLSPNDTLLLVEQPELHLHPRVQARLGDFFVGLSKCGKQCLIETHSENLISQLRYHIVETDGQENSDCLIYFVDQDEQGATRFETIEISPQGNILNWPDGFSDETMLQEDRITAASLRKRAKKVHIANNG